MSSNIIGTFRGIEYIEKINNGMINISTADPFEYVKNITLSSYNLEKQNVKLIINDILLKKPTDARIKIEIIANSLDSYVSFYMNDYTVSTLELFEKKIDLIRFDWATFKYGEYISSKGRGRNDELYKIYWAYVNPETNTIIKINNTPFSYIKNKVLSDNGLMDLIKNIKRKNKKNRRNILLLLKVVAVILLFIIIIKSTE